MKYDYSGQGVVVTGAASGMGLATARAFAEAGAHVCLADVDDDGGERQAAELRDAGLNAFYVHADVANEANVERLVTEAVSRSGKLDVFVAAAGILGDFHSRLHEQSADNLAKVLGVNVQGVLFGMKHAIRAMLTGSGSKGVVINFASVQSFRVHRPGAACYAASKAAVVSLTRSGALEYGADGIRVVGIAPGAIDTPMLRSAAGNRWPPRIVEETPLGRLGTPEEVAEAVLWLASDAASYVSGTTLAVDGGWLAP